VLNHAANCGRHAAVERGFDCYQTPPAAVRALLAVETFSKVIWEPACGPGSIVKVLRAAGHQVYASDLVDYGCPGAIGGIDFLTSNIPENSVATIITNPPYRLANDFVAHALTLHVPKVVMLLRLAFLEGQRRSYLLDGGSLARVYVFRDRLPMMHREGWRGPRASSSIAFAWYVFERGHCGPTHLHRLSWRPYAHP
jgi:hypothetical protein